MSGGDGRGLELRFLLVSFWEDVTYPPATMGRFCPSMAPWSSQPHLLPHRPQTLWSQTEGIGGQHRSGPSGHRGCGQGGPISPGSLLFISGGFTPTSAELKLSSYSCPVASTEASWQDPARAALGLHTVCQVGEWCRVGRPEAPGTSRGGNNLS